MDVKRLLGGIAGGLVGGVLFGAMMHMMGMIGMIAGLVGQEGPAIGWLVHLFNSALFGLIFAVTLGLVTTSWARGAGFGAIYGVIWWVLGALLIMPAWMGMPILMVGEMQLQSLAGHLVYGVALGLVFHMIAQTQSERRVQMSA